MSNQIELRHLRYFLAVAEELHFRKAADRLFISQPGLSRQIKQMEDELGFPLFERSNKKVYLTKSGRYLQNEVTLALKNLDDMISHAQLIYEGMEGQISLGYVGSAMQNVIPEIILRIKEDHPNIHYSLKEMENPEQIDALFMKEIDLAFVRLDKVPKGLHIRPVFEDTFYNKDGVPNKKQTKATVKIEEGKGKTFLLYEIKKLIDSKKWAVYFFSECII